MASRDKRLRKPKFLKWQKVWKASHRAGATTYSRQMVEFVQNGKVWLDNGFGNDFSGPFDAATGKYLGFKTFGFSKEILCRLPKGVTEDQIEK